MFLLRRSSGAIAQLGERLLCKQEVIGSIPVGSTSLLFAWPYACRLIRTNVRSLEFICRASRKRSSKVNSIDRTMSHDIVLLFNNPESFLF